MVFGGFSCQNQSKNNINFRPIQNRMKNCEIQKKVFFSILSRTFKIDFRRLRRVKKTTSKEVKIRLPSFSPLSIHFRVKYDFFWVAKLMKKSTIFRPPVVVKNSFSSENMINKASEIIFHAVHCQEIDRLDRVFYTQKRWIVSFPRTSKISS